MKLHPAGWLALGCLAAVAALAAPASRRTAHVDDSAQLLPPIPGDLEALEEKLAGFEHLSGIKVLVQFHAKSPSAAEDQVPGAYMRALSDQLGTRQHGVLVVYFADDPDWRIWIGDDLAAQFAGKPGTVAELSANKAIHDVKEALLASAHAKADAAFADLQKSSSPTPAQHLVLQTNAVLDALMLRLMPK